MTELMLPASEILKMCKAFVSRQVGPLESEYTSEDHKSAAWVYGFCQELIHEVGRRQNGEPSFEKRVK
jgi:hypothetical protein